MTDITLKLNADPYILSALREDVTSEDVTTNAIMPKSTPGQVDLIAKEDGILCGLDVFKRVFTLLDFTTEFEVFVKDGEKIRSGQKIAEVLGDIRTLLIGERTALNYLQRMSGIATMTRRMVDLLEGSKTRLLDTRKTTPNMRLFEKYAVKVGGATNHRYNLTDGVLIKDNHIGAAGSISRAVKLARDYAPFVRKIEVETESIDQVQEALDAGADIIMLDNMDHETMKQAIALIDGRALTEISGNVSCENVDMIKDLGADFVSSGALTHSAPILDLSLKNLHPTD
ncbi:MAG: carboxylating nicotinate-nucleotide diphosphorylase [Lachnospiraceae bacterium]|nr:carboxylating nicotinate-nucleotide diphosphorylase [Lachnospiraceae bacterium]